MKIENQTSGDIQVNQTWIADNYPIHMITLYLKKARNLTQTQLLNYSLN